MELRPCGLRRNCSVQLALESSRALEAGACWARVDGASVDSDAHVPPDFLTVQTASSLATPTQTRGTRASSVIATVVLAALHGAASAPCDMARLRPVLASPAMVQCTNETTFTIPNIAPYATGYDCVPDAVCLSEACGSAIEAIEALELQDCDLPSFNPDERLANVTAKLYAQHLNPVFEVCGTDTSRFGPSVTSDPAAMDSTKACTQAGLLSYYWGSQTVLAQCAGVELKAFVSSARGGTNAIDVVAAFTVCSACASIRNITATISAPVCSLPGRNISFRSHIDYAFEFCDALDRLRTGGGIQDVLKSELLNASRPCVFESPAMQAALAPLEDVLSASGNETCATLLLDPLEPISASGQSSICDSCARAKQVVSSMQLPSCQTRFDQRYDEFLTRALEPCPAVNEGTQDSSKPSDASGTVSANSSDEVALPTLAPVSGAAVARTHAVKFAAVGALLAWQLQCVAI